MCSGDAAKTIVDPGNFFHMREGGMSYAGMLDPGGEISNAVEGKKEGKDSWNRKSARKGAFGLLPDNIEADKPYTYDTPPTTTHIEQPKDQPGLLY